MRRGEALVRVKEARERSNDEIVQNCHPAIFELAALWKEHIQGLNALGNTPPVELIAALESRTERKLKEIHRKYSETAPSIPNAPATLTIFSEVALSSKIDEQGIAEGLHWLRHKTPLQQDVAKMESKDGRAARRVMQTGIEYEALRCDRQKPRPFKNDLEHFTLFWALWDFGIGSLSPEALTDFLNDYCPCGTDHDPNALRKQRGRFQKSLTLSA